MSLAKTLKRNTVGSDAVEAVRFNVERSLFYAIDAHMSRILRELKANRLTPSQAKREWVWRVKCYHCAKEGIGKLLEAY